MDNYKIKVNDEAESKEIISLFVQLGYFKQQPRNHNFNFYIYANNNGTLSFGDKLNTFKSNNSKELTLPQLRDLVAQSKSKVREYLDPNDNYKLCLINPSDVAHWMIEVPEGAALLTKDFGNYLTFWNGELSMNLGESEWSSPNGDCGVLSFDEYKDYGYTTLWSRESIKEQGLISGAEKTIKVNGLDFLIEGKDALRSALDGNDIQLSLEPWEVNSWSDFNPVEDEASTKAFFTGLSSDGQKVFFRLKPRTIKLEIEIPAPLSDAEQMKGQVYYLNDGFPDGYALMELDPNDTPFTIGAWRTEEEIKQVVAALRGIKQ
ncbi:hypothetical protein [Acinetobacter gyllenbergii]|uniref:hypothetical protein n=1 Tax=Acinetobacter gyllenbergii TaxID=134534 RepID=UPI003AF761BB